MIRFPRPLKTGDSVGITCPSSGITDALHARFDFARDVIEQRGYSTVVGKCMDGSSVVSATKEERADELQAMLCDPAIRAVIPPWGGELSIDLLDQLDWDAIAQAEPTWFVGYSDLSTLLVPMTLLCGVATIHGNNLMDTPYRVPEGLMGWMDIASLPTSETFTQKAPDKYREGFVLYEAHPFVDEYELTAEASWVRLDGIGNVRVRGRLIGGCIETLSRIAGTRYADVSLLARATGDPLIIYLEAADAPAYEICRSLHGMRLAGFFQDAQAVLIGRTMAPDNPDMTQYEAVIDALGSLNIPLIADVECGHVAPYMPLVNGALAEVIATSNEATIIQQLS